MPLAHNVDLMALILDHKTVNKVVGIWHIIETTYSLNLKIVY